ncbi:MAG: lipid II flippase MurJ [Thermodesulfobacteriota bacterium]
MAAGSIHRQIIGAAVLIGLLTVVVKAVALIKEMVVAAYFGAGDSLDSFLIALLLPQFCVNIITGSVQAALIPTLIEVREKEGQEAANRLVSEIMLLGGGLLLAAAVLLALVFPYLMPVLASGFGPAKRDLTISLLRFLLPMLFLNGLAQIAASVLNSGERFALAAIVPAATPACMMALVVWKSNEWGAAALAAGIIAGGAIEMAILWRGLSKSGHPLLPRWHGYGDSSRRVVAQFAPTTVGMIIMGGTVLVDQAMAAMLSPGDVAALNYGNRLVSSLLGLGATALGTAVLPHFSKMTAVEDWAGVRSTLRRYTLLILLAAVPLALTIFFLSEPLVRMLFERGAFTPAETRLVGRVQAYYTWQIPFYLLGILAVRLISALKRNKVMVLITVVNLIVNIVLNFILSKWLGLPGIALSTVVVYFLSTAYLFILLRNYWRGQGGKV